MSKIELSGIVVCQNNASTIRAVLQSLIPFCDEIVAVDGGSDDATAEIASQLPKVRLYEREFDNHARQKNFAFDQALGDWIVVLDTDELIGGRGAGRLRWLTRVPGMAWYSFPRYWLVERDGAVQYLADKPYYRDRQLRLFRNRPGFRYVENEHPVHHEFRAVEGLGRPLRNPHIFHYAFLLDDRERREAKVERYLKLEPGSERLHRMQLWEDSGARLANVPAPAVPLPATPAAHAPDLSVVICTRNRRAEIERLLASLASQRWSGRWEVLVVDNGSSDGTAALVRALAAEFPVDLRLALEAERGLSHARNRGLGAARGDAVVFLDDDVTCAPGWLAAHGDAFADPEIVGTAGRILPVLPEGAPDWWRLLLPTEVGGPTSRYDFGDEPEVIDESGALPPPFGANMGVRRSMALDVGGFDAKLGWGRRLIPSEDLDFFRRISVEPGRVAYTPAATVHHHIEESRTTRDYFLRWNRGYGRALVRMEPPRNLRARRDQVHAAWRRLRECSCALPELRREGDTVRELDLLRERERARGRCLELLGL